MTLEVDIEDAVVKWAKKRKFLTPKVKFVEAGYPDRLFISPQGHTIFIEFKKPGKRLTPIQEHRLSELQKRGIPATWCDSVHEAITILSAALETVLGTPPLSEEGDTPTLKSGIRRAVLGPWPGEDLNRPRSLQDLEGEKLEQANADNRAAQARAESMAGRDQEVVRLLRPDAYNPTWGRKGSEP